MSNYKVKLYNIPKLGICEMFLYKSDRVVAKDKADYISARIFIAEARTYYDSGNFEIECYDKIDEVYKLINKTTYEKFNEFINIGYKDFLNRGNMNNPRAIKKFLLSK